MYIIFFPLRREELFSFLHTHCHTKPNLGSTESANREQVCAEPNQVSFPRRTFRRNGGSSTRVQSRNNRLIFFFWGLSGNSAFTSQSSLNLFENERKVTASGPQQYKKLLSNINQCLTVHWIGSSKMFQTQNDQRKIWQQKDEVVVVVWRYRSQRKTNLQTIRRSLVISDSSSSGSGTSKCA